MSVEDLGAISLRDACRLAVREALKAGTLVRPAHCSECNAPDRKADGATRSTIHGHHDDYTKPLDVRWLCVRCHMQVHAPAVSRGLRRSNVARRGAVWVEPLATDSQREREIADGVVTLYDPAWVFAQLVTWRDQADEDDGRGYFTLERDGGAQRPLFVRPHPPDDVLAAEVAGERLWQVRDLRARVEAVRDVLGAWRARFLSIAGWVPPEGRRLHEGCFRAGPTHKPSVEMARAGALARHARERHARAVHQEAA